MTSYSPKRRKVEVKILRTRGNSLSINQPVANFLQPMRQRFLARVVEMSFPTPTYRWLKLCLLHNFHLVMMTFRLQIYTTLFIKIKSLFNPNLPWRQLTLQVLWVFVLTTHEDRVEIMLYVSCKKFVVCLEKIKE